jgi:Zn-finger nucleic acid-binding protein
MDDLIPLVDTLRTRLGTPVRITTARSLSDVDRHLKCPKCQGVMESYPYGGAGNVNVDGCEHCSAVWLDRGELRRIAFAPDYQPVPESLSDPDPKKQ